VVFPRSKKSEVIRDGTGEKFACEACEAWPSSTSLSEMESKKGWLRVDSQPRRIEDSSSSSSESKDPKR